jgi:hypothetical protein
MENKREVSPKKLELELLYDPEISLVCTYPKEMRSACQRDTCTLTITAPSLTTARTWSHHKCPSAVG